ncbi:acyl-CoA dehydrogenase family protein [Candidatus Poriferisodalis sp.]|uniref:acyl-CoA dehydrogenase family protein n=1 Tax=Candidatus Poriferisodalis sp. TaxID=3101277 RepID=UPI003B02720A
MSELRASTSTVPVDELRAELDAWLADHWDPDLRVRDWWQALAEAGLSNPTLVEPFGRGWGRSETRVLVEAMRAAGAIGAPAGLGMLLAAPTILEHGTPEQVARFVPAILNGTESWCQLFSEPGAGSDLAGLQTKAVRDGEEWIITGQKVWTSEGAHADLGMLVARTDPDAPKHRGLSWFAFEMDQDGVEVRPLREMTGRSLFNEVFIDGARVPEAHVIGELNDGWRVTNTTLTVERAGIGGSHGLAFAAAHPGSVAGHLDRAAGDFRGRRLPLAAGGVGPGMLNQLSEQARIRGRDSDPVVRQALAALHTDLEVMRLSATRSRQRGQRTGGEGSLAKLRMTAALRRARSLAGTILGPDMTLWGPAAATGGILQEMAVFSPAPSIYGGTDEIQRNILGERVLGLPREPGPDPATSFRELPHNATSW